LTPDRTTAGVLVIDKPPGLTSHDVVARVRKISGTRQVGHTGTLDPLATGVLLVCVGPATRLIEYMTPGRKEYRATIRFGISTDTLDAKGQILTQQDAAHLTEAQLKNILPQFVGEIAQYPPLFSALKKDGQPLYKLARAGKSVELSPRRIIIYNITWLDWQPPDLTIAVTCSAGTYIRSLARDLGDAVETGAHLTALVRTVNGGWPLEKAVSLEALAAANQTGAQGWRQYLQPVDVAIAHLPKVTLTPIDTEHVEHGRKIRLVDAPVVEFVTQSGPEAILRAYTPDDQFLAILTLAEPAEQLWKPKKVFHP
jgi:tRNA pseudouridine55 synthase